MLVRTELTKFAYVCSGVIRFECPNVKFDQYSEKKHKKLYSLIEFQGTPMLLVCAWSILIGQAADGSTCLQNPILALFAASERAKSGRQRGYHSFGPRSMSKSIASINII